MPTPQSHPDRPALGISLILLACLALAVHDTIIKQISGSVGIWQILLERSLLAAAAIGVFAVLSRGRTNLVPSSWGWMLARAFAQALAMVCYLTSLADLHLAVASALFYTSPILMIILSAQIFGERITWVQIAAVLVGFVGVLLITQPFGDGLSVFEALPLLAAFGWATATVINRHRLAHEAPLCIVFWLTLSIALVAFIGFVLSALLLSGTEIGREIPFATSALSVPTARDLLVIMVLAVLFLLVMSSYARGYQIVPVSLSGATDYSHTIFALGLGFVWLGELPTNGELLGILLVIAAGITCALDAHIRRNEVLPI